MSRTGEPHKRPSASESRLSRASVGRLSLYLRRLEGLLCEGTSRVSSSCLGEALGISDTQVRKDLASLGSLGQPGIGYDVSELIEAIRTALGIDRPWSAAMVGVGNLARALLRYRGFAERGFEVVAVFDRDPSKVGQKIEGLTIHSPDQMPAVIAATGAELGIITAPSESAQQVADQLIAAGIRGLL